jgi:hypothetical protein
VISLIANCATARAIIKSGFISGESDPGGSGQPTGRLALSRGNPCLGVARARLKSGARRRSPLRGKCIAK